MRYMMIVKGDENFAASGPPPTELMDAIGKLGEEAAKAGKMVSMGGLQHSSKGATVRIKGGKIVTTDGPFTESKELIAGFWLIQVKSKEEAIAWMKRAPFGGGTEIEIRQVFETEDFGSNLTPELRKQEERQRAEIAARR
jgi:hypothetical protein